MPPNATSRGSGPQTRGPWPFVGRADELRQLRGALGGAGAVVAGPAGSGKSALVGAAGLRLAGRFVATAAATDLDQWAVRALAGLAGPVGDPSTALLDALTARHRGAGPPIVAIDDIDHLDPTSLAVVVDLVVRGQVRLVATRRSTRPAPSSVAALWREAGLVRIDLTDLGEDEVGELLRQALGGAVDGRTAGELAELAGGNPALLRELVTGSLAAGTLTDDGGLWHLDGQPALTAALTELAESELSALDAPGREALEVLALAGGVPVALADALVDPGVAERLERSGLATIVERTDGAVLAVSSPVVAESLRRGMARSTRRRLSGELARAAEALGGAAEQELELRRVVWLLDSGASVAPQRELAAARLAVEAGDPGLAERLAARSCTDAPTTEAALLWSWCIDERGDLDQAEAVLAAHRPTGDEAAVAVAIRRAEQRFWGRRDPAGARALLDEAASLTSLPWPLAARAQQAVFDGLDGRPAEALAAAFDLVDHPTHLVASTAALAATFSLTAVDRATEADAMARAALERLAGPAPALFIDPGVHIIGLVFALHGAGELEAADELISEVYRHTLGRPGRQAQGWAALLRAHVLAARGRPGPAAEAALEAEFVWAGANLQGPARWSATVAALAHADAGEVDELRACVARADAYEGVPFRLFDPELERAHAWLAHHEGRPGAPERLRGAAAMASSTDRHALAAAAAHDLVRIDHAAAACQVLDRLPQGGRVTGARRALAHAARAADGEGLLAAAGAFAAMGAAGWAVEAKALAAACLPARAAVLRSEVADQAQDLGLATPPLRNLVARLPERSLTTREAEVVRLAASGLSNRAIAEELVVSLRTVENHLHRAFAKLGVTSRAELNMAGTGA